MKSLITLGAVALCGSLIADVSSQNIVGFANIDKATSLGGAKYSAQGATFITVGSANQRFRLYDMKITGSMNTGTKKGNTIQVMNPSTLVLDSAQTFYWDNGSGKNYWCYKNTTATTTKDTAVTDFEIKPGEGFLCTFPNNVSLKIKAPQAIKDLMAK